jgi:hypothetical protein
MTFRDVLFVASFFIGFVQHAADALALVRWMLSV